MDCPRCGQANVTGPACPRCGVVFDKLHARPRPRAGPPAPASPPTQDGWGVGRLVAVALVSLAAGLAGLRWLRTSGPPAAPEGPAPTVAPAPDVPPPTPAPLPVAPPAESLHAPSKGIMPADQTLARGLADRVNARSTLGLADVQAAVELLARHPEESALRNLLEAILLAVASQEKAQRLYSQAADHLRRAAAVKPEGRAPRIALVGLLLETADWAGAEAAAREALALNTQDAEALHALGYSLFRQDRNREAAETLQAALELADSPASRAILDRIRKAAADEKGMREQRLSHFHVRYDGEAHEDVGREILRGLERHYATLVTALDYEPMTTIPVILFSRERYHDASGAPAWSGGVYDAIDGRIRIPIGGLTSSLTPDMDGTLIHELTHAFVAERTRGKAPREIHEGLAQFMEGKRAASLLGEPQMRALADGRLGGVQGFYMAALSFVEYLVATRGLGGMNELLKAMGETDSVDEAFKQVYREGYQATRQAWAAWLRQRHGS